MIFTIVAILECEKIGIQKTSNQVFWKNQRSSGKVVKINGQQSIDKLILLHYVRTKHHHAS